MIRIASLSEVRSLAEGAVRDRLSGDKPLEYTIVGTACDGLAGLLLAFMLTGPKRSLL
jgi:hypothetical protein